MLERGRWWRLEHAGISERDVGRQARQLIGGKADRLSATEPTTAAAEAALDERIEHQVQKLGHDIECAMLGIGRHLAGDLRECVAEIATGQAEDRRKVRRQRAAGIEEVVDGGGDVLLVGV